MGFAFKAAIAQLAARRSHNPKVVSSTLTGRMLHFSENYSVLGPSQAKMRIVKLISTLRFEWVASLKDLYKKLADRKVEPSSGEKYISF